MLSLHFFLLCTSFLLHSLFSLSLFLILHLTVQYSYYCTSRNLPKFFLPSLFILPSSSSSFVFSLFFLYFLFILSPPCLHSRSHVVRHHIVTPDEEHQLWRRMDNLTNRHHHLRSRPHNPGAHCQRSWCDPRASHRAAARTFFARLRSYFWMADIGQSWRPPSLQCILGGLFIKQPLSNGSLRNIRKATSKGDTESPVHVRWAFYKAAVEQWITWGHWKRLARPGAP